MLTAATAKSYGIYETYFIKVYIVASVVVHFEIFTYKEIW